MSSSLGDRLIRRMGLIWKFVAYIVSVEGVPRRYALINCGSTFRTGVTLKPDSPKNKAKLDLFTLREQVCELFPK